MPNQLLSVTEKPSPSGVDWRVHPRQTCDLPTACQPTSTLGCKESRWTATIRNISPDGICLNLGRRFEPGTGLAVELPETAGRESYTVLAKVIYVKPQEDGSWSLGCKFVSELNPDEIERLLPSNPDRASSARDTLTAESRKRTIALVQCQLEIH